MKAPISIHDHGDLSTFDSVEEAEAYLEATDVERGEYIVKDVDGRRLAVDVVLREVPLFCGLWRTRVKKVQIADPSSRDNTRRED